MRSTVILGWVVSLSALIAMVLGHLGAHGLDWKANQISTYAARAPYDDLITASISLSAGALLVIGILVSKHKILGSSDWVHLVPVLAGAAASGLVMLAYYEETAATLAILKQSDFWAVRVQSFHDAGLQIFFYSAVALVGALGLCAVVFASTAIEKLVGCLILGLGPGSYVLMTTSWPKALGIVGVTVGLQQRGALSCLWLALACTLVIASKRSREAAAVGAD